MRGDVMKNIKNIVLFDTKKQMSAFTLSEVLITIVIIGVIAAMVVPSVMSNTNKHEYRTAIKKAISGLNQALELEYSLEGLTAQNFVSSEEIVQNLFMKRMNNIAPSVEEFTVPNCNNASPNSIFTTTDGMIFCVSNYQSDNSDEPTSKCSYNNKVPCVQNEGANIWIDVNGSKKPNKVTTDSSNPKDVYQALIYAQRVVPYGKPTQIVFYNKDDFSTKNDINNNQPSSKDDPTNPSQPEDNDDNNNVMPDCEDGDEYCMYDPDKWPSYKDYLDWMWGLMKDNQQ